MFQNSFRMLYFKLHMFGINEKPATQRKSRMLIRRRSLQIHRSCCAPRKGCLESPKRRWHDSESRACNANAQDGLLLRRFRDKFSSAWRSRINVA